MNGGHRPSNVRPWALPVDLHEPRKAGAILEPVAVDTRPNVVQWLLWAVFFGSLVAVAWLQLEGFVAAHEVHVDQSARLAAQVRERLLDSRSLWCGLYAVIALGALYRRT